MPKTDKKSSGNVVTLRINNLKGRMFRSTTTSTKRRNILIIYGLHGNIERWTDFAEDISQYANVTMPDLPGIGGMQGFNSISEKPSIDRMADYLASFVKLKYKNKRVTIVGLSTGFVFVTRMLQKYPDIAKKVDGVISLAGFTHYEDYNIPVQKRNYYRFIAFLAKTRVGATLCHLFMSQEVLMRLIYAKAYENRTSVSNSDVDLKHFAAKHARLWRQNDMRTHMALLSELLRVNNCRGHVDLPVWHVVSTSDNYLNQHVAEQHMRVIYKKLTIFKTKTPPQDGILIEADRTALFMPQKIRRQLSRR